MEFGSTKINIGKSKIHRKGLFAVKDIKKGEIIFIVKGKEVKFLITNAKEAKKINFDIFGISKNKWLDPEKRNWLFFNHSCNPNTYIRGRTTIVALRNIKKGEEITFDYSLNEADIFWSIKCNCHSKNCRKTITSIQFLDRKTFNKSIFNIPRYFQKIYKGFNLYKFKNLENLQKAWVDFIKKDFNV